MKQIFYMATHKFYSIRSKSVVTPKSHIIYHKMKKMHDAEEQSGVCHYIGITVTLMEYK